MIFCVFMLVFDRRVCAAVLCVCIDVICWRGSILKLMDWARHRASRYVAICNVHVVISAAQDASFLAVIQGADMATPDGAPVAWMMRRLGYRDQPRISGPDLMWALCQRAADEGVGVYCYGSTQDTLERLRHNLLAAFPALRLTVESPPFRPLTVEEDAAVVERINASGAGLVFVGLGCPKQERWMAEHRGRIHAVMLGVGAAFDFHAGTVRRAPRWMQEHGLEWLHRLCSEPRRLWKRYLVTNTVFVVLAAWQLLRQRRR